MHGVGGQRVAAGLLGHGAQGQPARHVHAHRHKQHGEDRPAGVHRFGAHPQAPDRGDQHKAGEAGEQAGLRQSRKQFELGVAIGMAFVGGLVGLAHREISENGGAGVERVMGALGQQSERA